MHRNLEQNGDKSGLNCGINIIIYICFTCLTTWSCRSHPRDACTSPPAPCGPAPAARPSSVLPRDLSAPDGSSGLHATSVSFRLLRERQEWLCVSFRSEELGN